MSGTLPAVGQERGTVLTMGDQIGTYKVAELVTLARDGSPVGWPMAPDLQGGRLAFSTGYVYPAKARNAQRDPRVAALFSDPTASGRTDADPLVLVQGRAEVFDQDLQANCDRYVDYLTRSTPASAILRIPGLRQLLVGYLTRIYIEVVPEREFSWPRGGRPPSTLVAARPSTFEPGPAIQLPPEVPRWLVRYPRPPVLSFVDLAGWPAAARVGAAVEGDRIVLDRAVEWVEGAPVSLTFHQLTGNYRSNDAFTVRGHLDGVGRLVPERVVGRTGTADDRGVGTGKWLRMMFVDWRHQLQERLSQEGRAVPRVRPSGRR